MTHQHEWTDPQPCGDLCQGEIRFCKCGADLDYSGTVTEYDVPAEVYEAMETALQADDWRDHDHDWANARRCGKDCEGTVELCECGEERECTLFDFHH
jgi:hypothetical protein